MYEEREPPAHLPSIHSQLTLQRPHIQNTKKTDVIPRRMQTVWYNSQAFMLLIIGQKGLTLRELLYVES